MYDSITTASSKLSKKKDPNKIKIIQKPAGTALNEL